MLKIEIPTDTPTEFELGDTAADIQKGGEERERGEKEEAEKQHAEERERKEARRSETPQRREWLKRDQSRFKKEKITNIYLTDSDEEAIVRSSMTRPTSTLRTRPERNACGRGSPAAAILDLNPKGLATENLSSPSVARLPRK